MFEYLNTIMSIEYSLHIYQNLLKFRMLIFVTQIKDQVLFMALHTCYLLASAFDYHFMLPHAVILKLYFGLINLFNWATIIFDW